MTQFVPELTADGSYTFYSAAFGEHFHSRDGAFQEAQQTYITATQLAPKAQRQQLYLLDICYGLGYNTAAALETIWRVNPRCQVTWFGLELDVTVPQAAIAQGLTKSWSKSVQAVLAALAQQQVFSSDRLQAQLRLGDARQQILSLASSGFQADAIFLDPFSPPRCPQLWSLEFLQQVANCLRPDGRLATYSAAAAVRKALLAAGLHLGENPVAGRRWPGTLASFQQSGLQPLSLQAQEHLQTRAAVPYRDPQLRDAPEQIQQRRQLEQVQSALEPTTRWRQRWYY
ncbi:tRNA (5-methylaminomethyl-2-thiouridine)(34)-methyltransferase MnmD [Sphaerothrix gracilis]|uniref:tRNA (5-methylaminomethyl-2-thiouridine)(34)-methyltransferase MnmD n=1 Tax=Sphaerothrix gracilis TaxID=3151835 RepID=UPI0031FD4725